MDNERRFNPAQARRLRLVRDDDGVTNPAGLAAAGHSAPPPVIVPNEPRALQVVRENRLAAHACAFHLQDIDAHDPRWVLAMQTQARLQGMLLTPERREELMRSGRELGLRAFESNLVIAVMQDRARRPHAVTAARRTVGLIGLRAAPAAAAAPRARPRAPWLAAIVAGALVAAGIISWLVTAVVEN